MIMSDDHAAHAVGAYGSVVNSRIDEELYDLERDPEELNNVANDPAYAEIRRRLEVALWNAQSVAGDHPSRPVPAGVESTRT